MGRLTEKKRRYVFLILLILSGLVLNIFAPRLFMGFNYLLGSIPVLLVVRLYGIQWGTLAGLIASSWTYILFGHPYAMVWLTIEPLFIGATLRYTPLKNLVLLNTIYWPLIGMPLLWFFFKFVMGLPFVGTLPAALMFWVIGIANSLTAVLLLQFTPLARLSGNRDEFSVVDMRMAFFTVMTSLVVYPAIFIMVGNGRAILQRNETEILRRLQDVATYCMQSIDLLTEGPLLVMQNSGEGVSEKLLQKARIKNLWSITPDGHLKPQRRYSPSFATNLEGGITEKLRHGNWAGLINNEIIIIDQSNNVVIQLSHEHIDEHLGQLNENSKTLWTTLVDFDQNILFTSNPRLKVNDKYQPNKENKSRLVEDEIYHVLPPMPSYITLWRRVQKSWYRFEPAGNKSLGWRWIIEIPFAPYQVSLLQQQSKSLQILLLLCISTLFLSLLISQRFSRAVLKLAKTTTGLAEKVEKDQSLEWPVTRLGEIETLSDNFKRVSDILRVKFRELKQSYNSMEEQVKARTQELQEAKEEAEQVYRLMPNALFAVDKERRIMIWNKKAEQVIGYSPDEILGKDCSLFTSGRCIENCMFTPESKVPAENVECKIRSKGGTELVVSKNIDYLRDASGNIIGGIESVEDITEKLRLEEQLRQAQKMEAVGTLAGGIAHDFNNMLGGIMGGAEILTLYIPDNPEAKRYHDMIMESANRAAALTSKLLTFSRSSHKTSTPVDMHEVINDALMLLKNTIDKRIKLELNLEAKSSTVIGDPSQLQSVILNLCINSSHAMPEGGTIFIDTKRVDLDSVYCRNSVFNLEPGEFINVEVRDTGEGIDPKLLDKVFEPFFTTKEQGKGTGLGLSSAYGTIKQHNGAITVYSEPGVGTTFHMFFPITHTEAAMRKNAPFFKKGTGSILVVDDEEVMRVTAKAILEGLGYSVALAVNGKEALNIFQNRDKAFDLILLDMVMPIMNGRDCFTALKKIDPEIRVVLSSGFTREKDLQEMKLGGLKGFIRKPYRGANLSQVVYDALQ